jgi:hypothetical protein
VITVRSRRATSASAAAWLSRSAIFERRVATVASFSAFSFAAAVSDADAAMSC